MTIVLGYSLAFLMGLSLGLIGVGGAMLAVPILVYLMGIKPTVATGYSLLIVGSTSLVGAFQYWREGRVDLKAVLLFSAPAIVSVYIARFIVLPTIPDHFMVWGLPFSKDVSIMVLFGMVMFTSAAFMLNPRAQDEAEEPPITVERGVILGALSAIFAFIFRRGIILALGSSGVGFIAGIVGVGGGFMIIPMLIAILHLPMKMAVGTSLSIISINSLVGFQGDLAAGITLDWPLLLGFITITLMGLFSGILLGRKIDGQHLRRLFGFFTLFMGTLVIGAEIYKALRG